MDACRGCCASQIVIGGAAWLRVGPLRNVQRRGLRTEDAGGRQEREGGGRTTGWTDGHPDKEIEGGFEMDGRTRMRREGAARAQHPGRRCISGAQTQQQQSKMRTMLAVVQPKSPTDWSVRKIQQLPSMFAFRRGWFRRGWRDNAIANSANVSIDGPVRKFTVRFLVKTPRG